MRIRPNADGFYMVPESMIQKVRCDDHYNNEPGSNHFYHEGPQKVLLLCIPQKRTSAYRRAKVKAEILDADIAHMIEEYLASHEGHMDVWRNPRTKKLPIGVRFLNALSDRDADILSDTYFNEILPCSDRESEVREAVYHLLAKEIKF